MPLLWLFSTPQGKMLLAWGALYPALLRTTSIGLKLKLASVLELATTEGCGESAGLGAPIQAWDLHKCFKPNQGSRKSIPLTSIASLGSLEYSRP